MFSVAVLPACAVTSDGDDPACVDGKCDGDGGSCPDKRYGNGTCDLDLSCAAPDIDCFATYDDDAKAAAFYGELEEQLAMSRGTAPRPILAKHPRFSEVRGLLDRGWEAFRENRPVGMLGDARPALVIVDDPSINAFVTPTLDMKQASFAVIVHSGLLDAPTPYSEDAMLGLMMHELQHAVGLHVILEVKERTKRFYVAPDGEEPIGRMQNDNPRVRALATEWLSAGQEVGHHANAELGGLPIQGDLFRIAQVVLQHGLQTNATPCERTRDLFNKLSTDLLAKTDPISGALVTDAAVRSRVDAVFASLKNECVPTFDKGFVEVVAAIAGVPPEQFAATLSESDRMLVANKHVVDAIRLLGEDRRAKMRDIEARFASEIGRPWSALRYFSTEEDADDVSVPVLRGSALDPTGLAAFFGTFLGDHRDACRAIIDRGDVPHYGVDLVDDHHGSCWRIYHIEAYAKATAKKSARTRDVAPLVDAPLPRRLLPPTLDDLVTH